MSEAELIMTLSEPLVNYLKEHCDPHTEISISSDGVSTKQTIMYIPNTHRGTSSDISLGEDEKMKNSLESYKTRELVKELEKREGVTAHWAEPYEDKNLNISGPALVLIVID